MSGKGWGCESANGPYEILAWEMLHKAAEPWYDDKEMIKTLKCAQWCFDSSFASLAARDV